MEKKESTEKITGIISALGIFQSEVPAITKKDSAGSGSFSYKYGGLPHIIETIKPHLKKANLCFSQPIVTREGIEYIATILYHTKTGEKIESKIKLPEVEFKGMNVVQSKGAIITYMRRYALMSILGLVTEDDDTDASGEVNKPAEKTKAPEKLWLNPEKFGKRDATWTEAVKYLADGGKIAEIKKKYRISKVNEEKLLNEAMTFDDLPFDRKEADNVKDSDIQPNLDFETPKN